MISDETRDLVVESSTDVFLGRVWNVRRDVAIFDGTAITRDYVVHPGAVGIIAINERADVLLVNQYRHPMGKTMWEPPAGLLDVADESALDAAKRELLEETGYVASTWNVLVDFANTPGGSTELIRCFLAQGLTLHSAGRPAQQDEEKDMPVQWVPVTEILAAIQAGSVTNALLVTGTLALLTALADPGSLRSADADWPARRALLDSNRIYTP